MPRYGLPTPLAFMVALVACSVLGALIQALLDARLERSKATHLVVLIASLGLLAGDPEHPGIYLYSRHPAVRPAARIARFHRSRNVRLTMTQLPTVALSLAAYAEVMLFAHRSILGKQIGAVASNPYPGPDHPAAFPPRSARSR